MTDYQDILVKREGAILWITINRPAALNSLTPLAHRELSAAYAAAPPSLHTEGEAAEGETVERADASADGTGRADASLQPADDEPADDETVAYSRRS